MGYPIKACVNSGECCEAGPCGFGKTVKNGTACAYLEYDENNLSRCGKHEEIIKDPSSVFSPAFGAGCCRNMFNQRRTEIIIQMFNGEEQFTGDYL